MNYKRIQECTYCGTTWDWYHNLTWTACPICGDENLRNREVEKVDFYPELEETND